MNDKILIGVLFIWIGLLTIATGMLTQRTDAIKQIIHAQIELDRDIVLQMKIK